jgi:hypothetical protein
MALTRRSNEALPQAAERSAAALRRAGAHSNREEMSHSTPQQASPIHEFVINIHSLAVPQQVHHRQIYSATREEIEIIDRLRARRNNVGRWNAAMENLAEALSDPRMLMLLIFYTYAMLYLICRR